MVMFSASAKGQNFTLNKQSYSIGDSIMLTISPNGKPETKFYIDFAKLKNTEYELDTLTHEKYADVEIISISNDTMLKENSIHVDENSKCTIVFRIFSLGKFKLIDDASNNLLIRVTDLDSLNLSTDIRDIAPIYEAHGMDWKLWLILMAIAVFIIAIAFYLVRKMKNRKHEKEITLVKDDKAKYLITLEKLDDLKNQKNWQISEIKDFQTQLNDIVREYIGHYFVKNAFNLTSDEILAEYYTLKKVPLFYDDLKEMFYLTDMIKFAKAIPEEKIFEHAIIAAKEFVNNTKPELP